MEVKITTCPVCGNRYFQEDYPECPICAGSIKRRQGETEGMTDREYGVNGSATLPLHTPETERRAEVKTEADVGKTLPPDHNPLKSDVHQNTVPVQEQRKHEFSNNFKNTEPPYDPGQFATRPVWCDLDPVSYPCPNPQPVPCPDEVKLPVVGWLVAMNGEHRGEDYQIRGYNTMIGRDRGNKIVLTGDDCISRTHCSIRYYADNRSYYIYNANEASNPVYVNREPLHEHAQLHAYDVIKIGRTELLFVPLCGREFSWNGEETCR